MDVIGGREVRELLVERDETGAIELQRIGCGEPAIEGIVVLRGAALGKEDEHFFDEVFFQRRGFAGHVPAAAQARLIGRRCAVHRSRCCKCAAKGEGFDLFVARVFNVDLARADAIAWSPVSRDARRAVWSIHWRWRSGR